MAGEALDYAAHLEVPNYHLSVFSGTGNESIALADVDICDEVEMAVQTRLQGERVSVPDLEDPKVVKKGAVSESLRLDGGS